MKKTLSALLVAGWCAASCAQLNSNSVTTCGDPVGQIVPMLRSTNGAGMVGVRAGFAGGSTVASVLSNHEARVTILEAGGGGAGLPVSSWDASVVWTVQGGTNRDASVTGYVAGVVGPVNTAATSALAKATAATNTADAAFTNAEAARVIATNAVPQAVADGSVSAPSGMSGSGGHQVKSTKNIAGGTITVSHSAFGGDQVVRLEQLGSAETQLADLSGFGAVQRGARYSGSTGYATNSGVASIGLFYFPNNVDGNQLITGGGSIGLGSVTVTGNNSFVSEGPIRSLTGFVGDGSGLTNMGGTYLTVSDFQGATTNWSKYVSAPTGATAAASVGQWSTAPRSATDVWFYAVAPAAVGGSNRWGRSTLQIDWTP